MGGDRIHDVRRIALRHSRWKVSTKPSPCVDAISSVLQAYDYSGRFRAGGLGRENCWVNSLTDNCVSALTPPPLLVPPRPARVGIEDKDEDTEEEASSLARKVLFISLGSDVSTFRVANGLAPSMEVRMLPAAL